MESFCFCCGFYDFDSGCTCPSPEKWYACPLEPRLSERDFEKRVGNEEEI